MGITKQTTARVNFCVGPETQLRFVTLRRQGSADTPYPSIVNAQEFVTAGDHVNIVQLPLSSLSVKELVYGVTVRRAS